MLSGVLNSERAVRVNIAIMSVFVKLRQLLATHKDLAEIIEALQKKTQEHDAVFVYIIKEIKRLKQPRKTKSRSIGVYSAVYRLTLIYGPRTN